MSKIGTDRGQGAKGVILRGIQRCDQTHPIRGGERLITRLGW